VELDNRIRAALKIKRGDSLPYVGWKPTSREDLVGVFADVGFKEGAEIGVSEGKFSRYMCDHVPGLHLLCVDPWSAYGRISQRICDGRYAEAVKMTGKYNVQIVRKTSLKAAEDVVDGSLDFVYIDGDHRFDAVMLDIILWAPKVKRDGVVALHDFYPFYQSGVVEAALAYTRAHQVHEYFITKEKEATFCWINKWS
jgi:predicted O-methyltransferase YrrM